MYRIFPLYQKEDFKIWKALTVFHINNIILLVWKLSEMGLVHFSQCNKNKTEYLCVQISQIDLIVTWKWKRYFKKLHIIQKKFDSQM
jgi:hypothetical protein